MGAGWAMWERTRMSEGRGSAWAASMAAVVFGFVWVPHLVLLIGRAWTSSDGFGDYLVGNLDVLWETALATLVYIAAYGAIAFLVAVYSTGKPWPMADMHGKAELLLTPPPALCVRAISSGVARERVVRARHRNAVRECLVMEFLRDGARNGVWGQGERKHTPAVQNRRSSASFSPAWC